MQRRCTTPDGIGGYFAWGETKSDTELGKTNYAWSTYQLCNGSENTLTKYTATDGKTVLEAVDDVATVKWGSNWQMPSKEQFEELLNSEYTTTIWTTSNNVFGWLIISKKNSKSIFLPAAGRYVGANLSDAGSKGYYWSCSLSDDYSDCGCYLYIESGTYFTHGSDRYRGQSIRPVRM